MYNRLILLAALGILTTGCHQIPLPRAPIYDMFASLKKVPPSPGVKIYKLYDSESLRFAFHRVDKDGMIHGVCLASAEGMVSRCVARVSGDNLYVMTVAMLTSDGMEMDYPDRSKSSLPMVGLSVFELRVIGRTLHCKRGYAWSVMARSHIAPQLYPGCWSYRPWNTMVAIVDGVIYEKRASPASPPSHASPPRSVPSPSPASPPATSPAVRPSMDAINIKLRKLKELRDKGLIKPEDYERQKKKLIESI
ncbi:MAG: SHOCT domain-containing protein [bacterium]